LYRLHAKRGYQALYDLNLLSHFTGTLVHDGWQAYMQFNRCEHALCGAHFLRDLVFLAEEHGQQWALELKTVVLDAKAAVERRGARVNCVEFEKRYDAAVAEGWSQNPLSAPPAGRKRVAKTKSQALLQRLVDQKALILAFLRDPDLPFDNNQAERDIRMMKVKQKVSGSFRTWSGAMAFASLRSYISTVRKQGQAVLNSLADALLGRPFMPQLAARRG
jgi:transposase